MLLGWLAGWYRQPYVPPVVAPGSAWCQHCRCWRAVDTIPAKPTYGIPAFTVCVRCGAGIDLGEAA